MDGSRQPLKKGHDSGKERVGRRESGKRGRERESARERKERNENKENR